MKKVYDLVIVGAGPGGAMAAKVAGENGLKAALIERKTDIRPIRRICTMIISVDEESFGEYITYRNKRFVFPHSGFTINYDRPLRKIYAFHIVTPNGNRFRIGDPVKGVKGEVPPVGLKSMLHSALSQVKKCPPSPSSQVQPNRSRSK